AISAKLKAEALTRIESAGGGIRIRDPRLKRAGRAEPACSTQFGKTVPPVAWVASARPAPLSGLLSGVRATLPSSPPPPLLQRLGGRPECRRRPRWRRSRAIPTPALRWVCRCTNLLAPS